MTTHPKSKSRRGGLFPAQYPGKARRSIFKVFSSIYWETFKQPTTYKIQTKKNEEAVVRAEPIQTSAASQRPRSVPTPGQRSGTVTILEERTANKQILQNPVCVYRQTMRRQKMKSKQNKISSFDYISINCRTRHPTANTNQLTKHKQTNSHI